MRDQKILRERKLPHPSILIAATGKCDDGNTDADQHNGDDQPCTLDCTHAVCGDEYTLAPFDDNPGEACDLGAEQNTGEYGGWHRRV